MGYIGLWVSGLGFPKIRGRAPIIKIIIFWGSILGSLYLGKLPRMGQTTASFLALGSSYIRILHINLKRMLLIIEAPVVGLENLPR